MPKIEMGEREPFLDERDCLAYHQQNEWLPGKDNITCKKSVATKSLTSNRLGGGAKSEIVTLNDRGRWWELIK